MKRACPAIAALLASFALAAPGWSADPSRTADIAERGLRQSDFPRWHPIVPNVYAYEDTLNTSIWAQTITTTSLVIVTTGGVVVVDGQYSRAQGQALADNIRKITPQPVKYMIIASDHPDHVGGNPALKAAWPDMVFISTPASKATMAAETRAIYKDVELASELVSDQRTLRLGGTEIRIINLGRAHTGGDLVVYLPASKLLYMSELYTRYRFPPMITAYPSEWVAAIRKAQAMDVTWYIPAHGFTDVDASTLKADLDEFLKATEYVIAEAKRLRAAGLACESQENCPAAAKANWGPYESWTLARWHTAQALARVYMELEGRLPK